MNTKELRAGAAVADITPTSSQFLYGYPFVSRFSTGVHDPLLSSALYLSDGENQVLFVANDVICVTKATTQRVRERICKLTGVKPANILVSATHTHSGPITVDHISNEADEAVPKTDAAFVARLEHGIVEAATAAFRMAEPAEIGLASALAKGIGTNRRDPAGPADPEIPVLLVRSRRDERLLACQLVYSMHPTVLHEDSTLVSGDFPGMARPILQRELGARLPILYHTGPAGNQSPRHVTRANTFEEAARLGGLLAGAALRAISKVTFGSGYRIGSRSVSVDLPRRCLISVEQATREEEEARKRLGALRARSETPQAVRTAEVDWFGATETLTLARAAADRRLDTSYESCLPAEIQLICVGPWRFVGWPGEWFVEYALEVKCRSPRTFLISLANGELQGYIVTEQASKERCYEASNGLFSWESGEVFVRHTLGLLEAVHLSSHVTG